MTQVTVRELCMEKGFANSLTYRFSRAAEPRIVRWARKSGWNEVDGVQTSGSGCVDGVSGCNPHKHEGQFGRNGVILGNICSVGFRTQTQRQESFSYPSVGSSSSEGNTSFVSPSPTWLSSCSAALTSTSESRSFRQSSTRA
jgi:hypothetical protein